MPTKAKFLSMKAYRETYPDRMAGGVEGIYKVAGLPFPHTLFPKNAACIWKRNG